MLKPDVMMDMTTFRSLALAERILQNTLLENDRPALMMVAATLHPLVNQGIDEATLLKLLLTDMV